MKYCKNVELRKKVFLLNNQLCSSGEFDNTEIIHKMLTYRHEYAQLLGFKDFSDFVLSRRMAKTGKS